MKENGLRMNAQLRRNARRSMGTLNTVGKWAGRRVGKRTNSVWSSGLRSRKWLRLLRMTRSRSRSDLEQAENEKNEKENGRGTDGWETRDRIEQGRRGTRKLMLPEVCRLCRGNGREREEEAGG